MGVSVIVGLRTSYADSRRHDRGWNEVGNRELKRLTCQASHDVAMLMSAVGCVAVSAILIISQRSSSDGRLTIQLIRQAQRKGLPRRFERPTSNN